MRNSIKFNRIVAMIAVASTVTVFSYQAVASPLVGLAVISKMTVGNSDNTFAIADANYLSGGHMQVANMTALYAITRERRVNGMLVTVVDSDAGTGGSQTVTYRLVDNPTADGSSGTQTNTDSGDWVVVIPLMEGNSGKFLTTNGTEMSWATASTGGITGGANLGTGAEIFAAVNGSSLEFRSLVAGAGVSVTENASDITIENTGVLSFNTRTGAVTLSDTDVTTALGYTPYDATNPDSYITIGALSGYATESFVTGQGYFSAGALTAGSVLFANGTTVVEDAGNFFWDDATNRLGIGTNTPTEKLSVAGNILATNLAGSGNRCVYADSNGVLRVAVDNCGLAGATGDDLGSHVASQNIALSNNWLSNDGGSEGIAISNTGIVTFSSLGAGILKSTSGGVISASALNLASEVTGILSIANGGTGASSLANLIALGTDTTGSYVSTVAGNAQVSVSGSGSETAAITLAIVGDSIGDAQLAFNTGQNLTTASSPTFAGVTVGSLSGLLYGSTGSVAAASVSAPLSFSAGTLSITQATTSTNGYLSSTDWNTFNNKLDASAFVPVGSDTEILFNDGGAFGTRPEFTFDKTTTTLGLSNGTIYSAGTLAFTAAGGGITSSFDGGDYLVTGIGGNSLTLTNAGGASLTANNGEDLNLVNIFNGNNILVGAGGQIEFNSARGSAISLNSSGSLSMSTANNEAINILSDASVQLSSANGETIFLQSSGAISLIANGGDISTTGSIIPTATNTYTLGSSGTRFATLFTTNTNTTNLTVGTLSGILKASSGVVSGSATTSDLPEGSNLYFTNARAIASTLTGYTSGAGTITASDTILSAIQKLNGNITGLVTGVSSVNSATGAVTLSVANTGTSLSWSGTQLRIPTATGSVTGLLSATDWNTFNNKLDASALTTAISGTTNYIPKFTGANTIGNSIIYDSGSAIGIGGLPSNGKLDITNATDNATMLAFTNTGANNVTNSFIQNATGISGLAAKNLVLGSSSGASDMAFSPSSGAIAALTLKANGNVGIGTTAPTGLLQVHGSANEVIVDSTGRLGIGFANASAMNASAAYKLQVNGAFTFGDGTNILGRSTYTAVGGNPAFASESGKGFTFYVDNANVRAIDISSAGNVGIGTTGPISPLTVQTNSIGVITASFINTQAGAYTSGTGGAGMVGYSDNGAATTNDTRLGWLGFGGAINSSHTLARPILIAAVATENWSGSANGADLTFATTQNGTTGRVERMRITGSGNVIVGATTGNANAILDVQSTTKAFMPPRMTTTQKNAISSPTAGMVVYDSTLNKLCVYGAASWETVTSV